MNPKRTLHAVALACALALTASAAPAADLFSPGAPLTLAADRQFVDLNANTVVYTGKVEIMQEGRRLRCDRLTVHIGGGSGGGLSTFGDISRLEAVGNVYLVRGEEVIRGDRADYDGSAQTLVVSGNVVIRQGEDVAQTARLTVNLRTGAYRLENGEGGRTRSILRRR